MGTIKRCTTALLGIAALAVVPLLADTAAYYQPPDPERVPSRLAKLVADRQFGFAPMTVNLSGMLQSRDGSLFPIESGSNIVLVVESPFLYMKTTTGSNHIGTDFRQVSSAALPDRDSAFAKAVEIRRPGRYVFRIHVLDQSGVVSYSNEVTVKAF
jgi:hypothetical protein